MTNTGDKLDYELTEDTALTLVYIVIILDVNDCVKNVWL